MSYIRDVGRWLQAHGHADAYVLSDQWKAPFVPAHPYLLSQRRRSRRSSPPRHSLDAHSPWRWQAVAFFTLMHSCGLRTGETRAAATRARRPARPAHRRGVVQGQPQPPAAADRSGHRGPGRLRPDIAQHGSARHGARSSSPPPATRSPPRPSGRCSTASGTRPDCPGRSAGQQPRPYDFRHHFAYANIERWMTPGHRRHRDAALPGPLHGAREHRVDLLLHPHLARLHGRLRRHHRRKASRCCRRSGSNETRPDNRRPGLLRLRPGLPAHLPAHGPAGRSPKTIEAYRISLECFLDYLADHEHIERAHVSFDHFDRQHLKGWLAWMSRRSEHYAPRTIALRLSAVKAFLAYCCRRRHHPRRAQPGSQGPTGSGQPAGSRSSTSPSPRHEPSSPRSPADGEIPQEPDAADPALRHRRPSR